MWIPDPSSVRQLPTEGAFTDVQLQIREMTQRCERVLRDSGSHSQLSDFFKSSWRGAGWHLR